MRRPLCWAAIALLPLLSACDSSDDTGLAACSFSVTSTGAVSGEAAGRADFTYIREPGNAFGTYAFDMTASAVNGGISSVSLVGLIPDTLALRSYPFRNGSEDGEGYWFGLVSGSVPLQSSGGSVTILYASPVRIEGRFTMEAKTENGATATLEGRFNAVTFDQFAECAAR